ncbi:MAG: Ig-like domain-containing protein [Planctomycetota bacterium]
MARASSSWLAAAAAFVSMLGCGGGGGGGGNGQSFGSSVTLVDVTFPDPSHQNSGDDHRVPDNASLIQQISFTFSDPVDPDQISSSGIQVRDALTREAVDGTFTVAANVVTFHAALPTRPIVALPDDAWQTGGAGLYPNSIYEVTVPLHGAGSIPPLGDIAPEVFARFDSEVLTRIGVIGRNFPEGTRAGTWSVLFKTTKKQEQFLGGYEARLPRLLSALPLDGSEHLSPKLITDPDHVFPPFSAYRLVFDQPLDPAADNVGDHSIELFDVTSQMRLGVLVAITANLSDRCDVQVAPSGILPFGHQLELRVPRGIRQISGASSGDTGLDTASRFSIAQAPGGRVRDALDETFADNVWQETSREVLGVDHVLADWNRNDSGFLQSAFAFEGGGELGPFVPLAPGNKSHTIILDTNQQSLPLFDGSTPGAKPGTIVKGGVFNFTDIIVPERVLVKGSGRNPLVLTATGSVMIAGVIDVSGKNGTSDQSYDSGITPTPGGIGGAGAGRGGVGHPTVVGLQGDYNGDGKPDGYHIMNFLPPHAGEDGEGPLLKNGSVAFARIGGRGGASGIKRSKTLDCTPAQKSGNDNGSRGAGGGGGTLLRHGAKGKDGLGDTTSAEEWRDPPHDPKYIDSSVRGGVGGDPVFVDGDPLNDYFGGGGELKQYLGGQGGGGGGSRLDSYFCGDRYKGSGFPETVTDSKGGGGGGGGGGVVIRALGELTLRASTGQILAAGGWGGAGEQIGCGNWGGCGGGGSGGLVVLESATMVTLDGTGDDTDSDCKEDTCAKTCDVDISVFGGHGGYPVTKTGVRSDCENCNLKRDATAPGAGGRGGAGVVQLMVPAGFAPRIDASILIKPDPSDDVLRTPAAEITPVSIAQSTWIDVGQVIQRSGTSPTWSFRGTDAATGYVITDAEGNVIDPERNTIKVDMQAILDPITGAVIKPGKADFISPDASVRVEFQAGDAVEPGAKEVAESSVTPWNPSIDVGLGHQFLRYRITFNIADFDKQPGAKLSPDSRLAAVKFVKLPFDF